MPKTGDDIPGMASSVLYYQSDLQDLPEKQDWGVSRLSTEEGHQKSEQTQTSCSLPMLLLMGLSWDGLDVALDGRLPNS